MSDWRVIEGFEDYEVSRFGDVRRVTPAQGAVVGRRIRRHTHTATGYPDVRLRKEGRTYSIAIHRLVAAAFLGPRPEGQQIRHLDGDKMNANDWNLRYGSAVENAQDKVLHGRSFFTGASNPKAKISAIDAQAIRELYKGGRPAKAIAEDFGLHESTVHRIVSGRYWGQSSSRNQDRVMR